MSNLITPNELIKRVALERDKLIDRIQHGESYGGPDPRPATTAEMQARLQAMKDVMKWVEEIEATAAINRVRDAIKGATA